MLIFCVPIIFLSSRFLIDSCNSILAFQDLEVHDFDSWTVCWNGHTMLLFPALRKEKREKIISSKRFRFDEDVKEDSDHGFTEEIVSKLSCQS